MENAFAKIFFGFCVVLLAISFPPLILLAILGFVMYNAGTSSNSKKDTTHKGE